MRTRATEGAGALTEMKVPAQTAELPGIQRAYHTESGCTVICGLEEAKAAPGGIWLPPNEKMLWHLSMAHHERYPTWDEIADVRYSLVPDNVTMAMLLPPMNDYVNDHPYCLHLWQIDDRRNTR